MRRAAGAIDAGVVEFLMKAQRSICPACRATLAKGNYHLDHIKPLARGGTNHQTNLQLLCPPCNLSKSAKDPIDFMQSKGFLL
jgi:5-methylcytosine-specific restriction endonuclease McrA